jgi:hypothetical protein
MSNAWPNPGLARARRAGLAVFGTDIVPMCGSAEPTGAVLDDRPDAYTA